MKTFLKRIPNPWRDLREANDLLDAVIAERNSMALDLGALRCTLAAEQAEIRALRAERQRDKDAIERLQRKLQDTGEWIAEQYYHLAGPAMDEVPMADEGSNVVVFSARLKKETMQ